MHLLVNILLILFGLYFGLGVIAMFVAYWLDARHYKNMIDSQAHSYGSHLHFISPMKPRLDPWIIVSGSPMLIVGIFMALIMGLGDAPRRR